MDVNYNPQQTVTNQGNLTPVSPQQTLASGGTSTFGQAPMASPMGWPSNYTSAGNIQQLNMQMAGLNVTDNGTNYLDYLATGQGVPMQLHHPAFYSPTSPTAPNIQYVQQSGQYAELGGPGSRATYMTGPTASQLSATFHGPFSSPGYTNQIMVPLSPGNQTNVPNATVGVVSHLSNVNQVPVQSGAQIGLNGSSRTNVTVPNSLPLYNYNAYPASYGRQEVQVEHIPGTPPVVRQASRDEDDEPKLFNVRPRQQISTPPTAAPPPPPGSLVLTQAAKSASETSSTVSSVPSSPASSGPHTRTPSESGWSDASGPRSPDYTDGRFMNGDLKSPVSPITNKPLQIEVKYPQDKCYRCMKKVYPMEKLGPVRGVVYHKGCFKCRACSTKLSMKSFLHNQADSFDLAVYCKSHQPQMMDKGGKLSTDSVHIKSALSAPKTERVLAVSTRVPEHKYSYDMKAKEIAHASAAPAVDLQASNKLRTTTWAKSNREFEHLPPQNVVRHDEPVPEYDMESYEKHQVENFPDYDQTR